MGDACRRFERLTFRMRSALPESLPALGSVARNATGWCTYSGDIEGQVPGF
jgi:hypothetical protein